MKLSIVIPVFNEEGNLRSLCERLITTLDSLHHPYEIIMVNDGSTDGSEKLLQQLYKQWPDKLRVINFNGNFGQHRAIMAGFERVRGDIVVTLDADLQNPPEEIPKLIAKIEEGCDSVGGIRKERQDNRFRRYASKLNNKIRYKITGIKMEDQGSMLRAYRRHIVDLMTQCEESALFIPALAYSFSSHPGEVEVNHDARTVGKSKYNIYRLMRLNFDLMTGFSLVPLQLFTFVGICVSLVSTAFVIYMFIRRLIVGPEAEGMFTLFAILYFLVGVLLMGMGILGEYIGRIYQTVRRRPRYLIKNILEN
ncbi:MAG: glycosyltransferase [Gammaproteobacteria bacterium]|nr:glycosyltransferase [Gammaproteobacteria bacterium]